MQKAKLYLVNGALGAGKTTFINHLLHQSQLIGARVIENEFANIGIDASQLQCDQKQIISIAGVCICCSTGNELVDALTQFANDSNAPVIIEATGVADTVQVIERLMLGGSLEKYDIATAYYILDAAELANGSVQEGVDKHLAELKLADKVLISKADLISPLQLQNIQMTLWYAGIDRDKVVLIEQGQPNQDDYIIDHSDAVQRAYGIMPKHHEHNHHHHDGEHCDHDHSHRHGEHDDCDDEPEYLVIDTAERVIDPDELTAQWPKLVSDYGLLRMKGDFLNANGQQQHVEATPAQIVTGGTPSQSAPLKIVVIGDRALSANL